MTHETLAPPDKDTFYFIGMTTGQSSIMRVFPRWAEYLGLDGVAIQGIDCKWHDDPEVYRKVVTFIKEDPRSLGSLVTTHKIDLLHACRDLFDGLGPHADRLGEISSISKRGKELWGHAKDPVTSGLSLNAFVSGTHWRDSGGALCLLGAGGSSLALTVHMIEKVPVAEGPSRIVITNRSRARLDHMKEVHAAMETEYEIEYHLCPTPEENDKVVGTLPPGSVVANATGLGKDAPGSPVTDNVTFPESGLIWDFNYRGDLLFMDQAREQQEQRGLVIEDGWVYFIHGWTRVIAEVFHMEIATSGPQFNRLSEIAANARNPQ